jgi:aryl-alcohol dehydrogenase-like predicted oxidoreductase
MSWTEPTTLGRSGLSVSRIAIGASYGIGAEAIERAFHERGVNTFYWGSIRRAGMRRAVQRLARSSRDRIVVALQTYDRSGFLMAPFVERGLAALGIERADLLILGWHNRPPSRRLLDAAGRLRERGLVRSLAISGHDRAVLGRIAADPSSPFDVVMFRYNAAHRGAEEDVLPFVAGDARVGTIAYTATRWGQLLDPKRMPDGERPPLPSDCYGFALTHPRVDVVLAGPADAEQLDAALATLTRGPLTPDAMERMRRLGDHVRTRG